MLWKSRLPLLAADRAIAESTTLDPMDLPEANTETVSLAEAADAARRLLAGEVRGRVLVRLGSAP